MDLTIDHIISYSSMITMALIPIYFGSHKSLDQGLMETMSQKEAWMYPVFGSCVLFGLYILFKLFSETYVNLLLTIYFLLLGFFLLAKTLRPFVERITIQSLKPKKKFSYKIPIPIYGIFELEFDALDIVVAILSFAFCTWYILTKNWIANNIFGLAFCVQAIALMSLGSYKIGCSLLFGLFFYDIFWVFGTDVMVTVAKKFDAPIKLMWPKQLGAEKLEFAMLGLGDIVIPGIFIALLLRYDAHRANSKIRFSKVYFNFTFASYFIGLVTTIFVMHTFKAAQPALLYLVPACVGTSFLVSVVLKDFWNLLAYSEEAKKKE
eukprot:TRINITY_DN1373_c0_g1_i1.p1 TRINITY_DN1373_c0_g1~~TRINITY_DN1373_c0_g1_i1.p1  ORF type:complete len:321 (-),score=47.89 TRINITY_DN1373_c0_g1_i1:17-979(-)